MRDTGASKAPGDTKTNYFFLRYENTDLRPYKRGKKRH